MLNIFKTNKNKKAMQFAWIFALIVGAIILFLALYFVGSKLFEQQTLEKLGQETSFDILLDPFSSFGALGASAYSDLYLQKEENLNFGCFFSQNSLGYDSVSVFKEGLYDSKEVYDKYIFTEKQVVSKNFGLISMPFSFPWRVADIMILFPKNKTYCFVSMNDLERKYGSLRVESLNISNFHFVDSSASCLDGEIKISRTSGDIVIKDGFVKKDSKELPYVGEELMLAAIFSDYEIYICNVKRLMRRLELQSDIYNQKIILLNQKGCNIGFNLDDLKRQLETKSVSLSNLQELNNKVLSINNANKFSDCSVF